MVPRRRDRHRALESQDDVQVRRFPSRPTARFRSPTKERPHRPRTPPARDLLAGRLPPLPPPTDVSPARSPTPAPLAPLLSPETSSRHGVIIDNWAENDVALASVGRGDLLGAADVPVSTSTSRAAFDASLVTGPSILANCVRRDREAPKPGTSLAHCPAGSTPPFYDVTVGERAFADPRSADGAAKIGDALWTGANALDRGVPVSGARSAKAEAVKARARAEMAGFDQYVTTTAETMRRGRDAGGAPAERRALAAPSAVSEGGQPATAGRKAVGGFKAELDRGYQSLKLRGGRGSYW